MAGTPDRALRRLREMTASGQLDGVCELHDLDLLVVHGSVLHELADAGDLDLAVLPRRGAFDLVALYGGLPAVPVMSRAEPHADVGVTRSTIAHDTTDFVNAPTDAAPFAGRETSEA